MINFFIKNKNIFFSIIIALVFAIVAYLFVPTNEYDLYQYRKWCYVMLNMNTKELLNYIFLRGEFIIMLYFLLIAKLGNIQLLQFFPVLIIYSILSYIILDYASKNDIKKRYMFLTFATLFSLFKYIFAVSSFRYVLAYSIYVLAIYFDFFKQRKKISYFLYILPLFIHSSVLILIFIRIIYSIKDKRIRIISYMLLVIAFIFPDIILYVLDKVNINGHFDEIINKFNLYLKSEKVEFNLQYIFRIIQSILMLLLTLYEKKTKIINKINYNFYEMYIYICIITITLFYRFSLFMRLIDFCTFLFIIVLLNFFKKVQINNWIDKIIIIILLIMMVAGIKIQIPIFIKMYNI